jgi:hypothetical protein
MVQDCADAQEQMHLFGVYVHGLYLRLWRLYESEEANKKSKKLGDF